MSTSSIRRVKDRGGAGGKVMALKPSRSVTPITDKRPGGGLDVVKKSTGKENPRPGSRVLADSSHKPKPRPSIRAMPRIEKAVPVLCSEAEPRVRRSTPSVPRGRSSSPSDFSRMLSDLRKQKIGPRGSLDCPEKVLARESGHLGLSGGKGLDGSRVLEKLQPKKTFKEANAKVNERALNGIGVFRKSKDSVGLAVNSMKNSEHLKVSESETKAEPNEKYVKDFRVLGDCIEAKLMSGLSGASVNSGSSFSKEGGELDSVVDVQKGIIVKEECKEESCLVQKPDFTIEKSLAKLKISEGLKEKGLNGEGVGVGASNKYSSNLHQKLAFLEGKVKRIALDIKRTKEMLDMNNPSESKVVLSDIQEKISGIEKAMGHALNNSDGMIDSVKIMEMDDGQEKAVGMTQYKPSDDVDILVKGMNSEELEARLFPHHKLLKNRTSVKASSDLLSHQSPSPVSGSQSKVGDKLISPPDANSVALEFLASISKEQSKVSTGDGLSVLGLSKVQETDDAATSQAQVASNMFNAKYVAEVVLTTNETIDEFDNQDNREVMLIDEETEDASTNQLNEIGHKASTGGWFVSEGESVLLAHDDGSCSFYDIANCEEKAEYKPLVGVSPNVWRDCWMIRAPGADGCSGKYVVAASAGNTMDSGFCSWDFYTKDVKALHIEDVTTTSRTVLGPLHSNIDYRRNPSSSLTSPACQQWWYKPCGPLIISTASCQRVVRVYDIRDGEQIMTWEVQKPVLMMDYSSPLQWRNRGKAVIAEMEAVTLCDVSSLAPRALLSIPSGGRKISALHVNNTDAELGGGVRQRVSTSEAEGNDGVFCTPDFINIMDFRNPSGVGLRIPRVGVNAQSVFSRGDSIYIGCTSLRSAGKKQTTSQVQHFSMRKQKLVGTYALPESNAHSHYTAITQVWGNSNLVMGVCGLGLFVFDALKDDVLQSFTHDYGKTQNVREIIGPDDLYSPSFDFSSSCALLISRDRPALWRHLS